MPFLPFVYGYSSSSPRAHCTPNKSVPTLRYTRRHGPIYTGPCSKALTECIPLDFRRSSIVCVCVCVCKNNNTQMYGGRTVLSGIASVQTNTACLDLPQTRQTQLVFNCPGADRHVLSEFASVLYRQTRTAQSRQDLCHYTISREG